MPTVNITVSTVGSHGITLTVDQFVLDLTPYPAPVDITWALDNSGAPQWVFSTTSSRPGVDIKGHGSFFQNSQGTTTSWTWTRTQKENPNKKYRYDINLVNSSDASLILTLDPILVNN
jgi:hypothetical protein